MRILRRQRFSRDDIFVDIKDTWLSASHTCAMHF